MASGTQHLRGFEPAQAPLFRVQYKHDSCPLGIVTSGSSRRRVWLTEVLSAGGKKHFVFVIRVVCVSVGVVVVVLLICVVEPLGSVATLNSNIIFIFYEFHFPHLEKWRSFQAIQSVLFLRDLFRGMTTSAPLWPLSASPTTKAGSVAAEAVRVWCTMRLHECLHTIQNRMTGL